MADICLVSMPTLGRAKSTIIPHWILWLAGYVEQKGYDVDVVDVKSDLRSDDTEQETERIFHETVERTVASGSPLIGLSAFTEDYPDVLKLATEIKRRSRTKIIVGGIHASTSPDDFFLREDSPFDAAVVGDGEIPLAQLAEAERNGTESWENIDGLVFRKGDKVVRTHPQTKELTLEEMPIHP